MATAAKTNTIEYVFNPINKNTSCSADGLRGFPIMIDQGIASAEPNLPFRTQFPPGQVWSYDAVKGNFNEFAGSATFFLYDRQYNVKVVRIVNKNLSSGDAGASAELQLWGSSAGAGDSYGVIIVPIRSAASSAEGDRLQRMLMSARETIDIASVIPQGDDVPLFSYTTCAEYGIVNKKFEVTGQSSAKINCVFFGKPILLDSTIYKKYVENTDKIQGIPGVLVDSSWVFNELMEMDKNRTVKIVKKYDLSAEVRRKAIFKKVGFTIPKKEGLKSYKVVAVDPSQLSNKAYRATLESGGDSGDLEKIAAATAALQVANINTSTGVKPKSLAKWIGISLGIVVGIVILMTIWYYGKRLFGYGSPAVAATNVVNAAVNNVVVPEVNNIAPAVTNLGNATNNIVEGVSNNLGNVVATAVNNVGNAVANAAKTSNNVIANAAANVAKTSNNVIANAAKTSNNVIANAAANVAKTSNNVIANAAANVAKTSNNVIANAAANVVANVGKATNVIKNANIVPPVKNVIPTEST